MSGFSELTDTEKRLFKWFKVNVLIKKIVKYQPIKNGMVPGIESVRYVNDEDQELYFTHPYGDSKIIKKNPDHPGHRSLDR